MIAQAGVTEWKMTLIDSSASASPCWDHRHIPPCRGLCGARGQAQGFMCFRISAEPYR